VKVKLIFYYNSESTNVINFLTCMHGLFWVLMSVCCLWWTLVGGVVFKNLDVFLLNGIGCWQEKNWG